MAASASNEHGATVLMPANNSSGSLYPIFMHTLFTGLVPPFSDFFLAILKEYGLLLAHLSPQAVATMAAFQHLCEAFVGVMPSAPLFRYFFVLRLSETPVLSGRLSWVL